MCFPNRWSSCMHSTAPGYGSWPSCITVCWWWGGGVVDGGGRKIRGDRDVQGPMMSKPQSQTKIPTNKAQSETRSTHTQTRTPPLVDEQHVVEARQLLQPLRHMHRGPPDSSRRERWGGGDGDHPNHSGGGACGRGREEEPQGQEGPREGQEEEQEECTATACVGSSSSRRRGAPPHRFFSCY
jgi:hypothetical protein